MLGTYTNGDLRMFGTYTNGDLRIFCVYLHSNSSYNRKCEVIIYGKISFQKKNIQ